jgi:GDPmannose 4,6-dehydratase
MKIKVLIIGGTGQIGFYLAKLLADKNIDTYISTRNPKDKKLDKFKKNLNFKINILKLNIYNKKDITNCLKKIKPNYIFYLAGQSSVQKSFYKKKETLLSNYLGCKNILDTIVDSNLDLKFFNATSTEIFGNKKIKLKISTNKNPVSPYGQSKLKSFNLLKNYRKKFKLKLYNGILSNCESFIRPQNFILPKICISAIEAKKKIAEGKIAKFEFGNINIKRDWGWAEEYVKTIWNKMQNQEYDFFVATGKSFYLKKLIYLAFNKLNLNWKNHIIINKKFFRKHEINSVEVYLSKKQKKMKVNGKKAIYKLLKYYAGQDLMLTKKIK